MIARLRTEPIPLRQRKPGLDFPVAVERVLAKAMARDVSARYATMPEFAEALRAAARPGGGVLRSR
jgi:hypothetical protein